MNTKHVVLTGIPLFRGFVLYDGTCRMCIGLAERFCNLLANQGFTLEVLQAQWVREKLNAPAGASPGEMKVLANDGSVYGGAAALVHIARAIWWARPFAWLTVVPGVMGLLDRGYEWVAERRHCLNGACRMDGDEVEASNLRIPWFLNALIPAVLLLLALSISLSLSGPAWVRMWTVALTLFYLFKWMSLKSVNWHRRKINGTRLLMYLFGWPGMDAEAFIGNSDKSSKPKLVEWVTASAWMFGGLGILWGVLPWMAINLHVPALALGWLGMVGVILVLHFGSFSILGLFWRSRGFPVQSLMRAPIFSRTISEFWGERWNRAFSRTVHRSLFKPLYRRLGVVGATLVIFGFSGLVHELVTSVPASGGYGWPSFYFLIQGLGLLIERSTWGRSIGMGAGITGRIWTWLIVGLPVGFLFHQPFVLHVMLPFFEALGVM